MPPRKKPASNADGDAPAPRRSTRTRAASAEPAKPAPPATKPASKAKPASKVKPASKDKPASKAKPASKSKAAPKAGTKRARADLSDLSEEEEEEEPAKKMVKVIKRGAAPVDPTSGLVNDHQVLEMSGEVWDAMLNQTDIGKNANKFYVIQLLHPTGNNNSCYLFTRWGRVGENGQNAKKGPFPSAQAINEFKKAFKSKAATNWEDRRGMVAKKGKYTWLERSFDEDEEKDAAEDKGEATGSGKPKSVVIPESTLEPEIQAVTRLIFNQNFVNAALSEMNYDANKLPLGKMSKSTILNGFSALKLLSEVINDPSGAVAQQHGGFATACTELTNNYYSVIPHVFGRNVPPVINDQNRLKRELDLVDALGDMQIAQTILNDTTIPKGEDGNPINPLDSQFRSLQLSSMSVVDQMSDEMATLKAYVTDSHGATHGTRINIEHAFRVTRDAETVAFNNAGHNNLEDGQRLLLWHGSRVTNFAGILRQGLRIAPPEAPVNGYMYSKGIYLADMVSKSAGYCNTHLSNRYGLILLCEAAVKPTFEQIHANYHADEDCKKAGKMSTHGVGRWQPEEWQDAGVALGNDSLLGVHMPKGPAKERSDKQYSLYYNEYIVYNINQVKLRYMLLFKT
ncbi:unnamed protein product [Peniophora sp. CBMAI 1063]|nr:unnamed protein product [Peniophora sp. CBMAI 1063]